MHPAKFPANLELHPEERTPEERLRAASAAAPYVHPKAGPAERTITVALPETKTAEDIANVVGVIAMNVASGKLTTTEGKNLTAIFEIRLRAMETMELEQRIAALEAREARK